MIPLTRQEDLKKFGLLPEFIGRLPIICTMKTLDVDALCRILIEPKNSIVKQYQELLAMDNVELVFEDEALKVIAQEAINRNTGARSLRSIVEELLLPHMFDLPDQQERQVEKLIITKEYAKKEGEPQFVYKENIKSEVM